MNIRRYDDKWRSFWFCSVPPIVAAIHWHSAPSPFLSYIAAYNGSAPAQFRHGMFLISSRSLLGCHPIGRLFCHGWAVFFSFNCQWRQYRGETLRWSSRPRFCPKQQYCQRFLESHPRVSIWFYLPSRSGLWYSSQPVHWGPSGLLSSACWSLEPIWTPFSRNHEGCLQQSNGWICSALEGGHSGCPFPTQGLPARRWFWAFES